MVVGQKKEKRQKPAKSKTHQTHLIQKPGFPINKTEKHE
jgi:hypothetical protein